MAGFSFLTSVGVPMTNDAKDMVLALVTAHPAVELHTGSYREPDTVRRQMAMYLLHVVLQYPMTDIGRMFRKDRTTVGHACAVIEDRRDDPAFDAMLDGIETKVLELA